MTATDINDKPLIIWFVGMQVLKVYKNNSSKNHRNKVHFVRDQQLIIHISLHAYNPLCALLL